MHIAVFGTGGLGKDSLYTPKITYFPKRAALWEEAAKAFPNSTVTLYLTPPAAFLWEDGDTELTQVTREFLPMDASIDEIADRIASDKPDIAIACTVADIPYDWNALRDALVANKLRARGIQTVMHSEEAADASFRKDQIQPYLREHGFSVAKQVFVSGALYFAGKDPGITKNRYQEFIEEEIKKLSFPVVIKPSAGAGSVGLTVAKDIETVRKALSKNGGNAIPADLIIEERIFGRNFGIEIYGTPGHYTVTPPVMFSETSDGVTDPFASVKFGPVKGDSFKLPKLYQEMYRLAELMKLSGAAEIDLMFTGEDWYIIEVNPRYSMLSLMPAAMDNESVFMPYLRMAMDAPGENETGERGAAGGLSDADGSADDSTPRFVLDFKSPMIPHEKMRSLYETYESIDHVMEFCMGTSDTDAVGYCEYVVSAKTKEALQREIEMLREREPEIVSDTVYHSIMEIIAE